jgi:hypothetical protein
METGRFGPYTVSLFVGVGGYYLLSDRSLAFSATRTIGPDQLGSAVDYHADWSFHVNPWLYRGGSGCACLGSATTSRLVTHAAALAVAGAVLVAAAQPLIAEDTWWHLAIGRVYAASGPWLSADPFLHTAEGPPAPAAWLADVALHAIERAGGFTALRGFQALLVAAILAAAWHALRLASGSRALASLGTALFAALAAYRLFQLRPSCSRSWPRSGSCASCWWANGDVCPSCSSLRAGRTCTAGSC